MLYRAFLRRRVLVLGIIIGVSLSFITVITSFNGVDYLTYVKILKISSLNQIDASYRCSIYDNNYSAIYESIISMDEVEDVAIVRGAFYGENGSVNGVNIFPLGLLGVYKPINMSGFELVDGEYSEDGVYVSATLAYILNITPGDTINVSITEWSTYVNKMETFTANFTVIGIYGVSGFAKAVFNEIYGIVEYGFYSEFNPGNYGVQYIVLPIRLYDQIYGNLTKIFGSQAFYGGKYTVQVKLDKTKIIVPWDIEQSVRKADLVLDKIKFIIDKHGRTEYSEYWITNLLEFLGSESNIVKSIAIFTLFPILILGIILLVMINWLAVDILIRDISLLKIRGASDSRIILNLMILGTVSGFLGGIVATLLSPIELRLIIGMLFPNELNVCDPLTFSFKTLENYLLYGSLLGALFGALTSLWVGRKASVIDISKYSTGKPLRDEEETKFGRLDKILLILGTYSVLEIGSGYFVLRSFLSVQRFTALIFFFGIAFMVIEIIATTVGPLFFMYATSKLVASNIVRLRKPLELIIKPILKDLSHLPIKSLSLKPKRLARAFLVLSFAVSLSIIMPIQSATYLNRERIESRIYFGSDIVASNIKIPVKNFNNVSSLLKSYDGIDDIVFCTRKWVSSYGIYFDEIIIVTPNYFNATFMDPSYVSGGTLNEITEKLSELNTTVVTKSLARSYHLKVDDIIVTELAAPWKSSGIINVRFKVVGIAKFLVGLSATLFDAQVWMPTIIISFKTAKNIFKSELYADKIFIKVKQGYDSTKVKEFVISALKNFTGLTPTVKTFDEYKEYRKLFSFTWSLIFFTESELYMVAVIAVLTMIIVMFVTILERKKETALYAVRGLSNRQVILIFISEAVLISVIALLIGVIVATSYSSFSLSGFTTSIFDTYVEYPQGYMITIPWYLSLIIVVIMASLILSVIPAFYFIYRREEIIKQLRENA